MARRPGCSQHNGRPDLLRCCGQRLSGVSDFGLGQSGPGGAWRFSGPADPELEARFVGTRVAELKNARPTGRWRQHLASRPGGLKTRARATRPRQRAGS